MYSRGMRPPVTLFSNSYSSPVGGVQRLEARSGSLRTGPNHRSASCACSRASRRLADGFAVSNLRLADVGLDLEFAAHAVDQDVEVELAHAADDGLAGVFVEGDLEGRVLIGELLDGRGELLLVTLGLGLDGDRDHGLREAHGLEHDLVAGSHRVSPVVVSFRPITA